MQVRLNRLEYSLELLQWLPSAFSALVPCMWPCLLRGPLGFSGLSGASVVSAENAVCV